MTSHQGGDGDGGRFLFAAGLADLALTTCTSAWTAARGLLARSDLEDLAAQGKEDLRARGRLALDRVGGDPAHLEILARHARTRGAGGPGA
ncbi:polyprenyl synthetase [Streptomyces sp. AM 2-1-1]|uniref:polyprenyl synthetase n=1 Tax=Streptomyces sp. AM 2-1-1 TaxID=3028709 RepID=UPI0023B88FCB|nr:polyprenyl synthetase [Streptomyces sp. AM 2-1-1]WEH42341.1 polyprenyl synthetase [Streptomyces sp. AM 2-1-1]